MNHSRSTALIGLSLLLLAMTQGGQTASPAVRRPGDAPDYAARLEAQRAVERVFYTQRLRYAETSMPGTVMKPFEQDVPEALLQKKVDEALLKSALLEKWWRQPLTAQQLQAEMERMARESKDRETLQRIFAVLGNDPALIAETLAREALADRNARNWYAFDNRFHGRLQQEAQALHARLTPQNFRALGGKSFSEVFLARRDSAGARRLKAEAREMGDSHLDPILLDEEEWKQWKNAVPAEGEISDVEESPEAFFIRHTARGTRDEMQVQTITLWKRSFDDWLEEEKAAMRISDLRRMPGAEPEAQAAASWGGYELPDEEPGRTPQAVYGTPGPDRWVTLWDSPTGRTSHSAVWTGSEMIIWGGYASGATNTGARYNPSTNAWRPTTTQGAPGARSQHTAVWTGAEMIVWGGTYAYQDADGFWYQGCYEDGARYNPSTDSWTPMNGAGEPIDRYGHTAVWTGSEMIVWGGTGDGCSEYLNTGGRYNPSTDTWTATNTTGAPSWRTGHSAVWTGERMILWGGNFDDCYAGPGVCTVYNDGYAYRPSADTWSAISTTGAPAARFGHTAVWTGTEMIVWGGGNDFGAYYNTGGRYNWANNSWTATDTLSAPAARLGHTAVWTGERMIIWGGSPTTNTGSRYTPSTNGWASTSTAGSVPSARSGHTAVWTGTEMIIWGGNGFNTGGRYNPNTNGWTATSTGTAPTARGQHSLVWTGSEMIVWGGYNGSLLNTGGRYVPATDIWTATTIIGAPTARNNHTAVWTGSEMIVWGGVDGGGYVNTGGRYVPGGAWTATTTTGAPAGRSDHTAVWTGTEMIVWGGYNGSRLNTGGRYVPGAASWNATDTATAPTARDRHTAVWTGTEMIVWGGMNSSLSYLNTGGRYVPGGAWTATPTAGAPAARGLHNAVWSGSQMVVWSGTTCNGCGGGATNTGGRYTPGGSWTATSTTGAPVARYAGGGHWTGKSMINWGGTSGYVDLNTGGQYLPSSNSWRTMTTQSAPTGRWGVKMAGGANFALVWGGHYAALNEGGIFYPNTDPKAAPDIVNAADTITLGQGIDLQLNGAASTTGSNPNTSTPNQDSYDSLASYEWDINGDGYADVTGASVSIPEASLGIYGLDFPGEYDISLKVTDSGGLTHVAWVTLTIVDGTPPAVEVVSPNGGETLVEGTTWPISWNGSDNIGLDHYEVYYTTSYCTDMPPGDPDAGSVLVAKGSGGDDTTNWAASSDFWRAGSPASLWHVDAGCGAKTGTQSFRYGVSGNCASFNTSNDRNGGWLISPRIPSISSTAVLSFWSRRDTEITSLPCSKSYDRAAVYVRNGAPTGAALNAPGFIFSQDAPASVNGWTLAGEICDEGGTWTFKSYNIGSLLTNKTDVYVGFVFDTVDGVINDFLGWMLDDVRVDCGASWSPINTVVAPSFNTLNWTVPSTLSATCRVKVAAVDYSNNRTEDISDSNFYIVQANTEGVRTVILTNMPRVEALWPGTSASLAAKVNDLAAHPRVSGVVLPLDAVPAITSAYAAWDAAKTNQTLANAVAEAIRSYLNTQITGVYTKTEYIVLVGDDRVIPFRRVPDSVSIYSENQYSAELSCGGSTVGSALCQNNFLSDDYYADLSPETTTVGQNVLYLPDYAIGRLVETPGQMEGLINTFIAQDGQVTASSVFVSGYDFLTDGATLMKDRWVSAGKSTSWLLGQAWNAADLQAELFGITDAVNVINSHDDHHSFGTPNGPLSTSTMAANGIPLTGSVFYNIGCHSGLNVPAADPNPLDVPETLALKGVPAFVGNTGFGWGLLQGVGLSEKLNLMLTESILTMNNAPLGTALKAAKRRYYMEDHRYDVFDEKVLQQCTLFGLPMYAVVVNPAGGSGAEDPQGRLQPGSTVTDMAALLAERRMKGIREERTEIAAALLPPGVTGLELNFEFGPGTHVKVDTPDGSYYTLNGQSSGEVGDAIQPLFVYDSRLSGTVQHGVLMTGGEYSEETGFDPVSGVPVSNNPSGGEGPLPQNQTFFPSARTSTEGELLSCVTSEIDYNTLTVHTGYYLGAGVQRIFNTMNFVAYYSNFCDVTPPVITDPGPGGAHTLNGFTADFSVEVTDTEASVFRTLITYTDNEGSWRSLDLAYNAGTGRWEGSLALTKSIQYIIQAVDAAGNTAVLSLTGDDLNALGQPYGSQYEAVKMFDVDISGASCADGFEPNGSFAAAAPIAADVLHQALVCDGTDEDYYALTLPSAGALSVLMSPPAGLNYDLFLYNGAKTLIASSTKGGSLTESIAKSLSSGGTYYLLVKGADGSQFSQTEYYALSYSFDAAPPPPCARPDEEIYVHMVTLDVNDNLVLHFMDPNQPSDVTGYNVYRSGSPTGPWTLIGGNVVDMDEGTPNKQFVDASGTDCGGVCYYSVAAYNGGCDEEGPWQGNP